LHRPPRAARTRSQAIDAAATVVEATGLVPNGIVAGAAIGGALRAADREVGALPSQVPEPTIYGMPVVRTPAWVPAEGDALVGDWTPTALSSSSGSFAGMVRTPYGPFQG
jgi:hypothetical protein